MGKKTSTGKWVPQSGNQPNGDSHNLIFLNSKDTLLNLQIGGYDLRYKRFKHLFLITKKAAEMTAKRSAAAAAKREAAAAQAAKQANVATKKKSSGARRKSKWSWNPFGRKST